MAEANDPHSLPLSKSGHEHDALDDELGGIVQSEIQPQDDPESQVKRHLLFHKALIDEDDLDEKLDHYLILVEQLESGMTIAFPNPFDRAIAITFELAIENHMDPWNIDLIKFSNEYIKHVKKDKNIDLVTAGRIILMAWKILKLQTEEVLVNAQQVQEEEDEYWSEPDGDWFINDEDFEYTTEVINHQDPPLHEIIWNKGKRRVSLMELVGAFEEARRESELHHILNERQAEERDRLKKSRKKNIDDKLHQENLQEDMKMIYERICKFNGHPIPLSDIYTGELDDKITTLVSSLFLAHDKKITIWQRKFPYGQIFVKNLFGNEVTESLKEPELVDVEDTQGLECLQPILPENAVVADKGEDDGGSNGEGVKIFIRDLSLNQLKVKPKKKKEEESVHEYITSKKFIAS